MPRLADRWRLGYHREKVADMTPDPDDTTRPRGAIDPVRLEQIGLRLEGVRDRLAADATHTAGGAALERLSSVIETIRRRNDPAVEELDLAGLYRDLGAIESLLDGARFPGHARVIASVRAGLSDLVPRGESDDEPPPPRRFRPPPSAPRPHRPARDRRRATSPSPAGRRPQLMLLSAWLVGLIAVVAFGVVRSWDRPETVTSSPAPDRAPPTPRVAVDGSAPIPTLAPWVPDPEEQLQAYERHLARVAREVDLARAALDADDPDAALRHFAVAVATDRHHRRVVDLARPLVDRLLIAADAARSEGDWPLAEARIAAARDIVEQFYLDPDPVDAAAQRLATTSRFIDLDADDATAIRAAIGREVLVTLTSGDALSGRLAAFDGRTMSLAVHSDVSGGRVQFDRDVPLGSVERVRVFDVQPSPAAASTPPPSNGAGSSP